IEVRRAARWRCRHAEKLTEEDQDDLARQAEQALNVVARDAVADGLQRILENDDVEALRLAQVRVVKKFGDEHAVAAAEAAVAAGEQHEHQHPKPAATSFHDSAPRLLGRLRE